jgi:uncharacterized protein (TIGR02271 family)
MPDINEVSAWRGEKLHGAGGEKLGTIEDIYLDEETEKPEWFAVKTGLFGSRVSFVPVAEATQRSGHVEVPYDKDRVKGAPHAEPDGALSQQEEAALYRHYGLQYSEAGSDTGLPAGGTGTAPTQERGVVGHDTSGPTTDDAMTRSEEELRVGKTSRETGRARLRKYIVTENVQTTVPVTREEVRIEREPITDANVSAATDGPALSEEEHEVVLHAEQPVVQKDVRPVERVRLDKDVVTEEVQVNETVRKEQIETDVDGGIDVDLDRRR